MRRALLPLLALLPAIAQAQEPRRVPAEAVAPAEAPLAFGLRPVWPDVALFAGGAATAFLAHEAGHAATNLALGNSPRLAPVKFLGVVPFFAVSPDIDCFPSGCVKRDGTRFDAGKRGLMLILLAGFDVQHITDEVLLTQDPGLRSRHAPFRTGLLAFNTLTSVGYAVANLVGAEPEQGDVTGAIRDTGASRPLVTGLLIGVAGLDLARWAFPDVRWLPWVSRAAKVMFLGMPLTI